MVVDRHFTTISSRKDLKHRANAGASLWRRSRDDPLSRLVGKDQSNGERIAYTLDNAGRTIMAETFDAENQLSTTSSTVYDGLGRVMQSIDANQKVSSYSYDANGNVTAVTDPNNLTTSTQYDVLRKEIGKEIGSDTNIKLHR